MSEANPSIGFVVIDVTDTIEAEERDITANPREGLGPLGVQFNDVEAEE